jgi:chromosome segregation ATPase
MMSATLIVIYIVVTVLIGVFGWWSGHTTAAAEALGTISEVKDQLDKQSREFNKKYDDVMKQYREALKAIEFLKNLQDKSVELDAQNHYLKNALESAKNESEVSLQRYHQMLLTVEEIKEDHQKVVEDLDRKLQYRDNTIQSIQNRDSALNNEIVRLKSQIKENDELLALAQDNYNKGSQDMLAAIVKVLQNNTAKDIIEAVEGEE